MHALDNISNFVWGPFTIVLLIGTGLLLSIRTRFVQFRQFRLGTDIVRGRYDDAGIRANDDGRRSSCQRHAAAKADDNAGIREQHAGGTKIGLYWSGEPSHVDRHLRGGADDVRPE